MAKAGERESVQSQNGWDALEESGSGGSGGSGSGGSGGSAGSGGSGGSAGSGSCQASKRERRRRVVDTSSKRPSEFSLRRRLCRRRWQDLRWLRSPLE